MNRHTRRKFCQLSALAVIGSIVVACISTQSTAAQAAIAALTSAINTVTAAIASGNFTGADLTDLQNQLNALHAQLNILTPTSTQSDISAVFDTVTQILGYIGQYLPTLLQLLPVLGMLVLPRVDATIRADHKEAEVSPGNMALIEKALRDFKAAAGK